MVTLTPRAGSQPLHSHLSWLSLVTPSWHSGFPPAPSPLPSRMETAGKDNNSMKGQKSYWSFITAEIWGSGQQFKRVWVDLLFSHSWFHLVKSLMGESSQWPHCGSPVTHNVTNTTEQSNRLQVMAPDVPLVLLRQQFSVGHPANAQTHLFFLLWDSLTTYGQK